jgi:hypothetical protein
MCPNKGGNVPLLYKKNRNEPVVNRKGEEQNSIPLSKRTQGDVLKSTAKETADEFFPRIGVAPQRSWIGIAADVIGILAKESGSSPWDTMLQLVSIAKDGQASGEVINNFWLSDSKWRSGMSSSRPPTSVERRAMVGMYVPDQTGAKAL